jgi:hypothetical protein
VGSGPLRLSRYVVAEQEVDRSLSSGGEQQSLPGCLVVSPPAHGSDVRCEPHGDGSQAEEPHKGPQEHTGDAANGDECDG